MISNEMMEDAVLQLRAQQEMIRGDHSLTPAQRAQRIRRINDQIAALIEQAEADKWKWRRAHG